MRLGFAVKVLGRRGLKSHDTRRWQNEPHLSVSLAYLRDIFVYLRAQNIHVYRMASDLAPYVTHPDMPWFHTQIEDCAAELAVLGDMSKARDLRLSFHPSQSAVLNALDDTVASNSAEQIAAQARILDAMALGPEALVVTHVGGVYGEKTGSRARFVERYHHLPPEARRRLALENDDGRFSVADVLWIHQETGLPLVFDYLHFLNHNPEAMGLMEALESCLRTWPPGIRPKIHFSSPRTAMRIVERGAGTDREARTIRAPRPVQHADFVDPFQFIRFMREARSHNLPQFDVMLEAKAKDLAVLHLRRHLVRLAPDLAVLMEDGQDAV
jgi:UV DNA damage endonuclease